MPNETIAFWKAKLLAHLHDPPSKVLDRARHGERSAAAMLRAGFTEEEVNAYNRPADHTAAATDRFPFPGLRSHGAARLRTSFSRPEPQTSSTLTP